MVDAVVNVVALSRGKMCDNRPNCSYHGGVDGTGTEEEVADDLFAVHYL